MVQNAVLDLFLGGGQGGVVILSFTSVPHFLKCFRQKGQQFFNTSICIKEYKIFNLTPPSLPPSLSPFASCASLLD